MVGDSVVLLPQKAWPFYQGKHFTDLLQQDQLG